MNHSMNTTDNIWFFSLDVPMNLLPVSLKQQIFRFFIISVGIVLNSVLLVIVSSSRQLLYPRHLFWLALSLINQFYLVQGILEIIAIVHKNRIACQMYVFHAGVGYSLLLLCLSLAALDRYLAIAQQEWYKRKVTNRTVTIILCGASFITYVAITSPFWTGFKRISTCTVNLTHMNCVLCWNLLLGILCFILHIKIFTRSRVAIRQYPLYSNNPVTFQFQTVQGSSSVECARYPAVDLFLMSKQVEQQNNDRFLVDAAIGDEGVHHTTSTPEITHADTSLHIHKKTNKSFVRSKINRLEIRAAINLAINVLPFWVCTFPVTCNAIALYWCIRFGSDCSIIVMINPHLRDMFLFHCIYNPIMYMLSSHEFRRAMSHFFRKKFRQHSVY